MTLRAFLLIFIVGVCSKINAQDEAFSKEVFINNFDTLQYRLLLPKDFSKEKKYPVVLFLHGAGERGIDNQKQLIHGSKLFLNETVRDSFPAIVIFPQCPKEDYWSNVDVDRSSYPLKLVFPTNKAPTLSLSLVMQLMDDMVLKSYVKPDQIYVGGLSMGGLGTFEILYRKPNLFSAAISICGGGNPETAKTFATKVPMSIFHGANDDVFAPELSIEMVSAILEAGGKPNFKLYAMDNHNSWDSTFAEPELLTWLFSNIKPSYD
ncbi:alpha/beta hydrolase-fold protein [Algibacter sp.]|uniref:carboxylesterase family protein n=1 Tax=Algibacter sp. TaxID=1872428 RepID=UPI003C76164E